MDNTFDPTALGMQSTPSEEDLLLLQRAETLYMGTYSHSLDGKGRLVVPQPFRALLGAGFYFGPTTDMKAIGLYSRLNWNRLFNSYYAKGPTNSVVRQFLGQFTALSFPGQDCDAQGRVLLPPYLREKMLGAEKDLIISGEVDHVRISTTAVYNERFAMYRDTMQDTLKDMDRLQGVDTAGLPEGR